MSIHFSLEVQLVVSYNFVGPEEPFVDTMAKFDLGNSRGYRKILPEGSDCYGQMKVVGGKEAVIIWLTNMRTLISDSRLTGALAYLLTLPDADTDGDSSYGYNFIVSWG